ncbi:hypothetical protein [Kineosporia succinea]|uniref:Lar family restriction alleviation protein n=1 Tax=Kineosporia succinea TaxID=84632 RepID=A0ABT9P9N5_9ACTN|nr:hypothetical protein [Kineosporia succinea]MDP9829405.1 hypothetical protein [Kineosporia succinea]
MTVEILGIHCPDCGTRDPLNWSCSPGIPDYCLGCDDRGPELVDGCEAMCTHGTVDDRPRYIYEADEFRALTVGMSVPAPESMWAHPDMKELAVLAANYYEEQS